MLETIGQVAKGERKETKRSRTQSRDDSIEIIKRNAKFILKNHPDQNDH